MGGIVKELINQRGDSVEKFLDLSRWESSCCQGFGKRLVFSCQQAVLLKQEVEFRWGQCGKVIPKGVDKAPKRRERPSVITCWTTTPSCSVIDSCLPFMCYFSPTTPPHLFLTAWENTVRRQYSVFGWVPLGGKVRVQRLQRGRGGCYQS